MSLGQGKRVCGEGEGKSVCHWDRGRGYVIRSREEGMSLGPGKRVCY